MSKGRKIGRFLGLGIGYSILFILKATIIIFFTMLAAFAGHRR